MRKRWDRILRVVLASAMVIQVAVPINLKPVHAAETSKNNLTLQPNQNFAGVDNSLISQRKINFNSDWRFMLGDNTNAPKKEFDDSNWRKLDLPHDWSIELDFDMNSPARSEAGYLNGGTGWYRKTFVLPESMAGRRISIDFGGVYMDSSTYINGSFVGNYPNGYTPFSYDITEKLVFDGVTENVVAIKVVNMQPSSRWYSGSGIYRDVCLTVTDPVHVDRYGTYITTPNIATEYEKGNVTVNVKTDVENNTGNAHNVVVKSTIIDALGNKVGQTAVSETAVVPQGQVTKIVQNISAPNPKLWSVDSPNMYKMITEILEEGTVRDRYETRFGFRWFNMDPNNGFSLNGQWMKLKGVCMHHDQGALGAVANYRAIERQMQILKDMGVNTIRVTHNPAAEELLEVCENLGMLVIEEAFDTWYSSKKTYDYGRFFEKPATHPEAKSGMTWAEFDLKQMVSRGKNCPAIIMWSLGNEIGEADGSTKSVQTVQNLVRWTKEIDATRFTTMGFDKFRFTSDGSGGHENVAQYLDAVGFNYAENAYDTMHSKHPDWKMYGSETSSATKSRGVYAHPDTEGAHDAAAHPDYQQSSYDNDRVNWGKTATNSWKPDRNRKHIAGQFIWTGFDYIGEPTPWHNNNKPPKSSYFGIVDTAGFPKDDYYLYQSQWTDVETNPMVHIMPHWNWEDSTLASKVTVNGKIPIRIYSNAAKVELFQDGVSLGEKTFNQLTTAYGIKYQEGENGKLYLEWRIPYKKGTIEAVAKDSKSNIIARDKVTTAEVPAMVKLSADRNVITADGDDLSYITVDITDKNGNFVPTAENLVNFRISGNGKIVGVDNGNAVTHERYKDTKRKAFNGKALVIVQSTSNEGNFTLTATSSGLNSDSVKVFTAASGEEKKVLGYKIPRVNVNTNTQPKLPQQIEAVYSDNTTKMMNVSWESISQGSLSKPAVLKVNGTVTDTGAAVVIQVIVIGIIGIQDYTAVTSVGVIPSLPAVVKTVYNDGTIKEENVTWDVVRAGDVATAGTIIEIKGTVTNATEFEAKAKVRVVSDTAPVANTTALLSDLKLDGQLAEGFSENKYSYSSELEYGAKIPLVTAVAKDNASVFVIPAMTVDFPARVLVTSEDGKTTNIYSVDFVNLPAKLGSAELTVDTTITEDDIVEVTLKAKLQDGTILNSAVYDVEYVAASTDGGHVEIAEGKLYAYNAGTVTLKAEVTYEGEKLTSNIITLQIAKNTVQKTITSYENLNIVVDKGTAPILPSKIKAVFDIGFPKEVPVKWDAVNPLLYSKYGEFTVKGTVDGQELRPVAKMLVRGVISVQTFSTATPIGVLPKLSDTAMLYYSDGTAEKAAVTWSGYTTNDFKTEGIVTVNGSVAGTTLTTKATVRVSSNTSKSDNYGKPWTGSTLPAAIASFTNDGSGSADKITSVNDLIISYTDSPQNRWTNWQSSKRSGDWVGIIFAKGGEISTEFLDTLKIGYFEDHGVSSPQSFKVQYYVPKTAPELPSNFGRVTTGALANDSNWADVTNVKQEANPLPAGKMTELTFDMVETLAIRINMTAKSNMGLAITEMEAYGKTVTKNAAAVISSIKLDGKALEGFAVEKTVYNVTLKDNVIPKITAEGNNNEAITVIPAIDGNSTAKVIVTSEDGLNTKTYDINFTSIAPEKGPMEFVFDKDIIKSGEEIVVTLKVNDTQDLYAFYTILNYNADLFTLEGVTLNNEFAAGNKYMNYVDNNGNLKIVATKTGVTPGVMGDAKLVDIRLRSKGASGTATFTIAKGSSLSNTKGVMTILQENINDSRIITSDKN